MGIPELTEPIWHQLITGSRVIEFEALPLKMFLTRARMTMMSDPSPTNVEKLSRELHAIFLKSATAPIIQKDIAKLA